MPVPSASLPGECLTQPQATNVQIGAKMQGPMAMDTTGKDPDVAFICGMIPHHQAAIDLAQVVMKSGQDPEARTFAEQVIRDQGRAITETKDWLRKYAGREGRR